MQGDDLPDVILVAIIAFVILFVGVSVLSTTADVSGESTTTTGDSERVEVSQTLDGSGSKYSLNDGVGENETLYDSRGFAVNLSGADDSYVQSDSNIQFERDENWTVATWAYVDSDASGNMTVLDLNGRVVLGYNHTATNWTLWYYDDGTTNSYQLELNAPDQRGVYTHLSVVGNDTHVSFYRNNSQSTSQNISDTSVVNAPVNSSNFDGRLEETRTFDDALNDSQRQRLIDGPIEPQPGWNRTTRIMFDEPYASKQLILFSGASLETSNVTFSSGFAGSEVDAANYSWSNDGPQVSVDPQTNYPVVYIDYDFTATGLTVDTLTGPVGSTIILAGLIPVILILGYVALKLGGFRSTR